MPAPGPYPAPLHMQYGEDTVHVDGDQGFLLLGVRKDAPAALAGADGDYSPLAVDALGRLVGASGGPTSVVLLASAARVASTPSADQTNVNARELMLIVNVTARAVATTLTPTLQIKDSISGNYFTVWSAAAAINSAAGTFAYIFYPGASAAGSFTESKEMSPLSRTWRLNVTHLDANSITYSVSAELMP